MTRIDYNDTSVQSQPRRNAGSRNEGGFGKTPRGLAAHGSGMPTAALISSLSLRGVVDKLEYHIPAVKAGCTSGIVNICAVFKPTKLCSFS